MPINNCNPTITTTTTTTTPSNNRRGEQLTRILYPSSPRPSPPSPLLSNGYDRWNDRNGERLHVSGPSQEWRRSSLIPECQQKLRNIRLKYFSMRRLLTCRPLLPPPTYTVHYWPCARQCYVVIYSGEWKLATGPLESIPSPLKGDVPLKRAREYLKSLYRCFDVGTMPRPWIFLLIHVDACTVEDL